MIRFVTEDEKTSPFVYLFNKAYCGVEKKDEDVLYCARSNTRLYKEAKRQAKGGNRVIVYMDMVPDNEELYQIYDHVFDLYRLEGLDVVIMPIVCAEYLFIQSLYTLMIRCVRSMVLLRGFVSCFVIDVFLSVAQWI